LQELLYHWRNSCPFTHQLPVIQAIENVQSESGCRNCRLLLAQLDNDIAVIGSCIDEGRTTQVSRFYGGPIFHGIAPRPE